MNRRIVRWLGVLAGAVAAGQVTGAEPPFPWQVPHAKVIETGELQWTPKPYEYRRGQSTRYIDFAAGDDSRDGSSPEQAWKHHPWDPAASGKAKSAASEVHTYVFKGGVIYRGVLRPPAGIRSTADNPVRLTADPAWGSGMPVISGAAVVSGWKQGQDIHPRIVDAAKVYSAEVNFLPRNLWAVAGDGSITRLKLARTPNWTEPDPNDVMSEWRVWENPEWWKGAGHEIQVDGKPRHAGIDTKHFTGKAEDYVGGTVWSEWGIVMGSPYPAKIEAFDEKMKAVAFRGPWTFDKLEKIIKGNRYYIEDLPQMLDEPGEFWVQRLGNNRARIFLRLPGDADPATVTIEAGRHINLLDAAELGHLDIAGLTFRYTNTHWDYNNPSWSHPDIMGAVIRLRGSAEGLTIRNCLAEHVNILARISTGDAGRIGTVSITDNQVRHTDAGAVYVNASNGGAGSALPGSIGHVDLLRNKLEHIGWRIVSGEHGHAVNLVSPQTSHVAGNFLHRIGGWGISVTGGNPGRGPREGVGRDVPFVRHLVHHNRVEDALCKSNDWGAVETWQGGPFYVWNNLVINPLGFKHWTLRPGDPKSIGSFGHAYYLDGAFKNYLFNNIAAGRNNQLGTKSVNSTALQNIFSFENTFFHNTFHRFAAMTRQQEPSAGRFRYIGNVFEDVSDILYRHADPKDGSQPDPNASHYSQGGKFHYATLGYAGNVMFDIRGSFGVFEETGVVYPSMSGFVDALKRTKVQTAEVGTLATRTSIRNAAARDFRPAENAPSAGMGRKVFVPWALSGVVGEWNFIRNNADPTVLTDEHWYITPQYTRRETFKNMPRYPLKVVGLTEGVHVAGLLDNWTPTSAVALSGTDQYLLLEQSVLTAAGSPEVTRTVDIGNSNLLIEVVLKTQDPDGVIVSKLSGQSGYQLSLEAGKPTLRFRDASGAVFTAVAASSVASGEWTHVVAELDRNSGVRVYVDGKSVPVTSDGTLPKASLSSDADFTVGGGPDLPGLAATLDFLRVARGTLTDAKTTIEELHAWQTAGPHLADFAGTPRQDTGHNAGALTAPPATPSGDAR
jgi:hypothetical protein